MTEDAANASAASTTPATLPLATDASSNSTKLRAPPVTSEEVNLLVLHYLQDSGFSHAAFALRNEAALHLPQPDAPIERGLLVKYLQKGLLYDEVEQTVQADGTIVPYLHPLRLLGDATPAEATTVLLVPPSNPPPVTLATPAAASAAVAAVAPTNGAAAAVQAGAKRKAAASPSAVPRPEEKKAKRSVSGTPSAQDQKPRKSLHKPGQAPRNLKPLGKDEAMFLEGHKGNVYSTVWHPKNPSILATSAADGTVRIWDLPEDPLAEPDHILPPTLCVHKPRTPSDPKDLTTMVWNAQGTQLASGAYDGGVWVWSAEGNNLMESRKHTGPVFAVRFNQRGDRLLSVGIDQHTIVWDLKTRKVLQKWHVHTGSILDADWLDNDIFATAGGDRVIGIFKVGESQPLRILTGHSREVNQVRWDPSRTLLATGSDDTTLRIWKLDLKSEVRTETQRKPPRDKEVIRTMTGHTREIGCITWAPATSAYPDKKLFASGGMEGQARIWDVETGECLWKVDHSSNHVFTIDFAPDARMVAIGGADARVTLWHTLSGQIEKDWLVPDGLYDLRWRPDGKRIAFGTKGDGLVVVDMDSYEVQQREKSKSKEREDGRALA